MEGTWRGDHLVILKCYNCNPSLIDPIQDQKEPRARRLRLFSLDHVDPGFVIASGTQVEDITQQAAFHLVELCVFALLTGNVREFLMLHIKDLTEVGPCCSDLSDAVSAIATFWAFIG